jgi:ATP-dependent Zn protease
MKSKSKANLDVLEFFFIFDWDYTNFMEKKKKKKKQNKLNINSKNWIKLFGLLYRWIPIIIMSQTLVFFFLKANKTNWKIKELDSGPRSMAQLKTTRSRR